MGKSCGRARSGLKNDIKTDFRDECNALNCFRQVKTAMTFKTGEFLERVRNC
jgi:hypothetical protein